MNTSDSILFEPQLRQANAQAAQWTGVTQDGEPRELLVNNSYCMLTSERYRELLVDNSYC